MVTAEHDSLEEGVLLVLDMSPGLCWEKLRLEAFLQKHESADWKDSSVHTLFWFNVNAFL